MAEVPAASVPSVPLVTTRPAAKKANGPAPVKGRFTVKKSVRGEDRKLKFTWEGDSFDLLYSPFALSTKEWDKIRAQIRAQDPEDPNTSWVVAALARMIVSWEMYADDDVAETYPLTEEAIGDLPPAFNLALLNAIWDDQLPKESAATSGSFS